MSEFKYLGKESSPNDVIDTFSAPNIDIVTFKGEELTAFCPVTSQPDFYQFAIEYEPDRLCIESKSLKLYIMTFRDKKMFAEALCQEIAQHLYDAISPKRITVTLVQQVRGGITLTAKKEIK